MIWSANTSLTSGDQGPVNLDHLHLFYRLPIRLSGFQRNKCPHCGNGEFVCCEACKRFYCTPSHLIRDPASKLYDASMPDVGRKYQEVFVCPHCGHKERQTVPRGK